MCINDNDNTIKKGLKIKENEGFLNKYRHTCPHLVDLILGEGDGSTSDLLTDLHQVLLDVLHDDITTLV